MIVCGMVLLVLSWTWLPNTSSKRLWSDEQAKAYAKASLKFHQLSHQNLHLQEQEDDPVPFAAELSKAKGQYRELRQQLDRARNRRKNFSWLVSGLGVTLVSGGCLLTVFTRNAA